MRVHLHNEKVVYLLKIITWNYILGCVNDEVDTYIGMKKFSNLLSVKEQVTEHICCNPILLKIQYRRKQHNEKFEARACGSLHPEVTWLL